MEGNARAEEDLWQKKLNFFKSTLLTNASSNSLKSHL